MSTTLGLLALAAAQIAAIAAAYAIDRTTAGPRLRHLTTRRRNR